MTTVFKRNGKSVSITKGMVLSGIVSTGMTTFAALLLAFMLDKEHITWQQAGYWIMGILFLSSFMGAKTATTAISYHQLVVSCMSATLYMGILLSITALFFGGNYESVAVTAGIVIAGSGCAAMLSLPRKHSGRKIKRKR